MPDHEDLASMAGHYSNSEQDNLLKAQGDSLAYMTEIFCQVPLCAADLSLANIYFRRHSICPEHCRAPTALINGTQQRFCQQCGMFQQLSDFDGARRSCRAGLAAHNARRKLKGYKAVQGQPAATAAADSGCFPPVSEVDARSGSDTSSCRGAKRAKLSSIQAINCGSSSESAGGCLTPACAISHSGSVACPTQVPLKVANTWRSKCKRKGMLPLPQVAEVQRRGGSCHAGQLGPRVHQPVQLEVRGAALTRHLQQQSPSDVQRASSAHVHRGSPGTPQLTVAHGCSLASSTHDTTNGHEPLVTAPLTGLPLLWTCNHGQDKAAAAAAMSCTSPYVQSAAPAEVMVIDVWAQAAAQEAAAQVLPPSVSQTMMLQQQAGRPQGLHHESLCTFTSAEHTLQQLFARQQQDMLLQQMHQRRQQLEALWTKPQWEQQRQHAACNWQQHQAPESSVTICAAQSHGPCAARLRTVMSQREVSSMDSWGGAQQSSSRSSLGIGLAQLGDVQQGAGELCQDDIDELLQLVYNDAAEQVHITDDQQQQQQEGAVLTQQQQQQQQLSSQCPPITLPQSWWCVDNALNPQLLQQYDDIPSAALVCL